MASPAAGRSALRSVEPPQASVASNPVPIHWGPVGPSPGLNELQIPGFTGPMRLTRSGGLIRLVVPRDPSPSPTSPAKWWCKWWCICRAASPISQCLQAFLKPVQRTPSPFCLNPETVQIVTGIVQVGEIFCRSLSQDRSVGLSVLIEPVVGEALLQVLCPAGEQMSEAARQDAV